MSKRNIKMIAVCMTIVTVFTACGRNSQVGNENSTGYINHEEEGYGEDGIQIEADDEFYRKYEYICTETEGDIPLFDTEKEVNILFAGNSLLRTPKTNEYFEKLVERYHLPVKVVSELWDGMNIKYQVLIAGSQFMDVGDEYANADIIIIQEYGNYYETTFEDLCELIDGYCKEDVIVYYYTTEWNGYYKYIKEMNEDERIHILDFGKMQNRLNEIELNSEVSGKANASLKEKSKEFNEDENIVEYNIMEDEITSMYEYLHLTNDYHPNELNGFLAASIYLHTII